MKCFSLLVLLLAAISAPPASATDWCAEFVQREKDLTAIEACTRAIDSGEGNQYSARLNRAVAFQRRSLYAEALLDLDAAIALDARNSRAYQVRGLTYALVSRLEEAEADVRKAAELDPQSAAALMAVVEVAALRNRIEDSCSWLKRAIEKGDRYLDYVTTEKARIAIRNSSCFRDIRSGR